MKTYKKSRPGRGIVYLILIFWALTTIFPFAWVLLNSFKTSAEVLNASFALPKEFSLDNYHTAFSRMNIGTAYKNSLIISGSVTIGVMVLSAMMSFAMTRYRFRGRRIVQSLLAASLMFPVFSTIIPVYRMMIKADLMSTNLAVILPHIAGNLSFAAIVMIGFMKTIPIDLEEAAYMEGAHVGQVFLKIIVPLCKASLSTVAIFSFMWSYNDLFVQKIMIRDNTKYPISNLLETISSQYGTDFGLMASSVTLIVLPVLIVYIFLQKNIIKGLTAGAMKG